YPKIHGILSKLTNYSTLSKPLLGQKIKKSKRVFDDKKVTDHHAIIPTGIQNNLQYNQQKVYDIIVRRFIGVFYPDSEVSNTSVIGKAAEVPFKTTGKEILTKGWRVVFETETNKTKEEATLPTFVEREKGPHEPSFLEKETKPPRNFTEASLLRAMETAGKQVDDDEMRELMKENGIGRPSTRASIIETLFRRKYIERKKKLVLPTEIGIALIDLIDNELLKSAELTGRWEKRLKEIERGEFKAGKFIHNMKKMVYDLVTEVKANQSVKRITSNVPDNKTKNSTKTVSKKKNTTTKKQVVGKSCPKCKNGTLIKGGSAYGCSEYKTGCKFIIPFKIYGKKISENQLVRLVDKGSTTNLKGFITDSGKVEGSIEFDEQFGFKLKLKEVKRTHKQSDIVSCPKCKKGKVLKGKTAYGCSEYKTGCDFVFPFQKIKEVANGKALTKELVLEIISG
ncbi:MAG: DNA topoisomerase, partial [Flavobacteriales bacterium]